MKIETVLCEVLSIKLAIWSKWLGIITALHPMRCREGNSRSSSLVSVNIDKRTNRTVPLWTLCPVSENTGLYSKRLHYQLKYSYHERRKYLFLGNYQFSTISSILKGGCFSLVNILRSTHKNPCIYMCLCVIYVIYDIYIQTHIYSHFAYISSQYRY